MIFAIGISYRTASLDLRECLALSSSDLPPLLSDLRADFDEVCVLSTCNRTEVYGVADRDVTAAILHRLAAVADVSPDALAASVYALQDTAAVNHLFAVAAGIDSLIIGEPQILAQIKAAWEAAHARDATGPVLNTLFRLALAAGKDVRSRTVISRGATSVAHASVEIAKKQLGSLRDRRVLVLGAGDTGRLAALNLVAAGATGLTVVNRTYDRASALARAMRGTAIPFGRLPDALAEVDLLVTCATTRRPLLSRETIARAMADRPERDLLILDLAVPRNIDSAAAGIPGVSLFSLDDLQRLCEATRHARSGEARRAERLVAEWVERFSAWERGRAAVPLIRALRERMESARRAELEHVLRRLPGLEPRDRAKIDRHSAVLLNRLLHHLTVWLREASTPEQRQWLAAMWASPNPPNLENSFHD